MGLTLAPHLSFCLCGGEMIFLDLYRDKYFRLSPAADRACRSLMGTNASSDIANDPEITRLVASGFLQTTEGESLSPAKSVPPTASLFEASQEQAHGSLLATLSTIYWVSRIQGLLKSKPLVQVLAHLARRKARVKADPCPTRLHLHARQFLAARLWAPCAPVCLLDSLALAHFLISRGHRPDVVFGVTIHPFSAHSWVQMDSCVLNDALAHATAHTAIRVV